MWSCSESINLGKRFRGAQTGPTHKAMCPESFLGFSISPVVARRVPDHFSPTLSPTALAQSCCHCSETTTEPPLLLPLPDPPAPPSPSCLSQPLLPLPAQSCLSGAHCCQSLWQSQLCWAREEFWTLPCSPAESYLCLPVATPPAPHHGWQLCPGPSPGLILLPLQPAASPAFPWGCCCVGALCRTFWPAATSSLLSHSELTQDPGSFYVVFIAQCLQCSLWNACPLACSELRCASWAHLNCLPCSFIAFLFLLEFSAQLTDLASSTQVSILPAVPVLLPPRTPCPAQDHPARVECIPPGFTFLFLSFLPA